MKKCEWKIVSNCWLWNINVKIVWWILIICMWWRIIIRCSNISKYWDFYPLLRASLPLEMNKIRLTSSDLIYVWIVYIYFSTHRIHPWRLEVEPCPDTAPSKGMPWLCFSFSRSKCWCWKIVAIRISFIVHYAECHWCTFLRSLYYSVIASATSLIF